MCIGIFDIFIDMFDMLIDISICLLIYIYIYTQEDLIIVEGELIIHRRAYLRIQRLAKSQENTKKINKIKEKNNHRRGLRPRPTGARSAPVVMVVVSFDFIDRLCVFLGFRQSLYP